MDIQNKYESLAQQLLAAQALDNEIWEDTILSQLDLIWYGHTNFRHVFRSIDNKLCKKLIGSSNVELKQWAMRRYYPTLCTDIKGEHGQYNSWYRAFYVAIYCCRYFSLAKDNNEKSLAKYLYR